MNHLGIRGDSGPRTAPFPNRDLIPFELKRFDEAVLSIRTRRRVHSRKLLNSPLFLFLSGRSRLPTISSGNRLNNQSSVLLLTFCIK